MTTSFAMKEEDEMEGNAKTLAAVRPSRPSDMALEEIERLNARLSSTLGELGELRDRIRGSNPQGCGDEAACETAFAMGGFVGGVGQSIERAHRLLTDIGQTIGDIAGVI